MIADDLRTYLLAQDSIKAQVSTRIFEDEIPQKPLDLSVPNNLPCLVLTNSGTQNFTTFDGPSGLVFESYDVECKANSKADANALRELLKPFLNGYSGALGSQVAKAILIDDEHVAVEDDVTGGDVERYVSILEITIQYLEAQS